MGKKESNPAPPTFRPDPPLGPPNVAPPIPLRAAVYIPPDKAAEIIQLLDKGHTETVAIYRLHIQSLEREIRNLNTKIHVLEMELQLLKNQKG